MGSVSMVYQWFIMHRAGGLEQVNHFVGVVSKLFGVPLQ